MAWAITLEISDCAVPSFKIEGARISDETALGTGFTDANGQLIYNLSERIKQSVDQKFGVQLEREVNII